MADKFMDMPNDDTKDYHFCRLHLNDPTNQNSLEVLKVDEATNKNKNTLFLKLWRLV